MKCNQCNRNIPDGSKFCPYCGKSVTDKQETGIIKEKKKFPINTVLLAVLIAAVCCFCIIFLVNANDNSSLPTFVETETDEMVSVSKQIATEEYMTETAENEIARDPNATRETSDTIPMLKPGNLWFNSYFEGTDEQHWSMQQIKSSITRIVFWDEGVPEGYTLSWDASATDDGSIMVYLVNDTEIVISGNGSGRIFANPDSSCMFSSSDPENVFGLDPYFGNLETIEGLEILDTSMVTSMQRMFLYAGSVEFKAEGLNTWNTSNVTDMRKMFGGAGCNAEIFSLDLTGWDTSNVTDMGSMFSYAGSNSRVFSITGLSGWNTSSVTDMNSMFYKAGEHAESFEIGDLSGWDTSNVTDMSYMFEHAGYNAPVFDIGGVSAWNISASTDTSHMFTEYTLDEVAWQVIGGKWDDENGDVQWQLVEQTGYDRDAVQAKVEEIKSNSYIY